MKEPRGPSSDAAVAGVAFDRRSGEILHVHHIQPMAGAAPLAPERIKQMVKRDAAEIRGRGAAGIGVLVTEAKKLVPGRLYRVDVERERLVAVKDEKKGRGGAAGGSFAAEG